MTTPTPLLREALVHLLTKALQPVDPDEGWTHWTTEDQADYLTATILASDLVVLSPDAAAERAEHEAVGRAVARLVEAVSRGGFAAISEVYPRPLTDPPTPRYSVSTYSEVIEVVRSPRDPIDHGLGDTIVSAIDAALGPSEGERAALSKHPGEHHEFRIKCERCGKPGYLNVALVGPDERFSIEPLEPVAALGPSEGERTGCSWWPGCGHDDPERCPR